MAQKILARGYPLLIGALLIHGCTQAPRVIDEMDIQDGAGELVDTRLIANAVPKMEPVTRAGNSNPYTVLGETYHLLPTARGYKRVGTASWYGSKFHGRKTANGEVYDMYAMTAAHRTLPIPAYARVTNLANQRVIVVRINDRGPFHASRIIDLSYAAALKLGFADHGTAEVEIEVITPTSPRVEAPMPNVSPVVAARLSIPEVRAAEERSIDHLPSGGVFLQIGAFAQRTSADRLQRAISAMTSLPIEIIQHRELFKVKMGPIKNSTRLKMLQKKIRHQQNIVPFILWP
ncbi:MAG: septal ring lytic transglycosylase RlpA family protein [Cellvibrionales bacterium]